MGGGSGMGDRHICVLYGGRSLERDISLLTGHRVVRALQAKGYRVTGLDVDESLVQRLEELRPDGVFIAMHGKGGEDGTVQELLEILGLPYTGSGVLASIQAMDKVLAKHIFRAHGIPTPDFHAFNDAAFREMGAKDALPTIAVELGLPIVVKPAAQGSALGINFAAAERDLPMAMVSALSFDRKVLLERYVRGRELAVSILGDDPPRVLPIVEVVPDQTHEYYDFDSRYVVGESEFIVPAELDATTLAEVERVALATYRALGCRAFGRVDIILDDAGTPWVLELNTIPGLTETSTMPQAAAAAGIAFDDLVVAVMEAAFA
jgi:D-alanine-D-alanine ligase